MSNDRQARRWLAGWLGAIAVTTLLASGPTAWAAPTAWSSAVNGLWSDTNKWNNGVPNMNAVSLTPSTASYTVTVDVVTNPFCDLTVNNGAGKTTTLDVNAAGFQCVTGFLAFGRGAVINVNTGGFMMYTGALPAYTFASIADGGVMNVNGGTVAFTNLSSADAYTYFRIGTSGTGSRMNVASGRFMLQGRSNTRLLVGTGGGPGTMEMSGGTSLVSNAGGATDWDSLAVGAHYGYAQGEVRLSGDAVLIVGNGIYIGNGTSSSGRVTVADNARLVAGDATYPYTMICDYPGAQGYLTVTNNGTVSLYDTFVGGISSANLGSGGTGVLTVAGGTCTVRLLDVGACHASASADGTLNISGGTLQFMNWYGYGLRLGNPAVGGRSRAALNMSGGVLAITNTMYAPQVGHPINGLAVGQAGYTATSGVAYAVVNMSGGSITNRGQFGVGVWAGGTGEVFQSGGNICSTGQPTTIGWGGGNGKYVMTGGSFFGDKEACVGGITTNLLGASIPGFTSSTGSLDVQNGSFIISNTMYVGLLGSGTVTIQSNATVQTTGLVLTNGTSTLKFQFGPTGITTMRVAGPMSIGAGSKLEVNINALANLAQDTWFRLVDCNARDGVFAPSNITVNGKYLGVVDQTRDEDIWIKVALRGSVVLIR